LFIDFLSGLGYISPPQNSQIMSITPDLRKVYVETYGCQMNVADSELVGGILSRSGYTFTEELADASVVLVNTCAIRENAEQRIYGRLGLLNSHKKRNPGVVIGILGCMAERLRSRLVDEERLVDIVVGPDEYRKLPSLIERAFEGEKGIAVRLSRVEAYDDIIPLRTEGVSAWLSVMRGCDKFCTFCVVPFTRGRERSRPLESVVEEVALLAGRGYREVTLLGQNVNSYRDGEQDFADLMRRVAAVDPAMRIRFTTSHPQDLSDRLIDVIAATPNICNTVHLPVQSGSDRILRLMNRTYTVNHYLRLVEKLRRAVPGVSLSTDIISGFPTETAEDHESTLALMREVRYDGAYTFKYSARENTKAWEMPDDVPEDEKGRRVSEITTMQHGISLELNTLMIGSVESVLVEGRSRKSEADLTGRTETNKTVVFPGEPSARGELVDVRIERVNSATLFGTRIRGGGA
jgi:tRNA-2-methylthio-N6-dimethylallyladenosine synthase